MSAHNLTILALKKKKTPDDPFPLTLLLEPVFGNAFHSNLSFFLSFSRLNCF